MAMLNNQRVPIESTVTWSKAEDVARATAGKERNAERARTVCKPIKDLQIDWRQVGLSCISLTGFVSFRVSHVQSMFHLLRSHFFTNSTSKNMASINSDNRMKPQSEAS